jgi:hypothetical protein
MLTAKKKETKIGKGQPSEIMKRLGAWELLMPRLGVCAVEVYDP